jgi:hypothetical protein
MDHPQELMPGRTLPAEQLEGPGFAEPVVPVFLSILIYTHIICQCRLSIDHISIYVYINVYMYVCIYI